MMEKFTQTWDLRLLQRDLIARVSNHAGRFFEALLGDVNYVHYVNICSLLPFKNYSKGRRRTFVRWWLLVHIRIASPPSCALKEVCGTRLNMHKPISAPTTILYHTDSKHNTMTHAPFLHTSSLTFACAQLFHGSTFYSRWWSCVKASFQLTEYEWCARAVHNAYKAQSDLKSSAQA